MTAARWATDPKQAEATPLHDAIALRNAEWPTATPTRRAFLRELVEKASAV